jgi:hypothetical protein
MSVIGGRGGRPDDWTSQHDRARARAAERLDGPLEASEAAWLDEHLASCDECSAIAADYAAQRLALRALRDPAPVPPRDLWARTAAAIEREPRHGSAASRRPRGSALRPFALLAGALVVAIAVGALTSSQWPFSGVTTTPGTLSTPPAIAAGSPSPSAVAPTPLAVGPKDVAYLSIGTDGSYNITTKRIDEVCPSGATGCVTNQPHENSQSIGPLASPETVFGSEGKPLVVMGSGDNGSSVVAILVPTEAPGGGSSQPPSETPATTPPEATATPTATSTVAPSGEPSSEPPTGSPAVTESPTPSPTESSPSTSEPPSPMPSLAAATAVEIARDLHVVDTNAGYAPDGSAFAFTAEPADGSHGPDIYIWHVGDERAEAVTSDHRSVFGSWAADGVVGSSLDVSSDGSSAAPQAIVVKDATEPVALPAAGSIWRPVVDRSGTNAVYWTGSLARDGDGWQAGDGRLVIGRWGDAATAPDASAPATAPAASDQAQARHETTIAKGPLKDWDARWDETGTRLAVWIADPKDPTVGKLSLYVVNPFDGTIDLADPPLHDAPALAGFSIDDGRLAWAAPDDGSADGGRVLILAWTNDTFGKVESAPGDFLLVR